MGGAGCFDLLMWYTKHQISNFVKNFSWPSEASSKKIKISNGWSSKRVIQNESDIKWMNSRVGYESLRDEIKREVRTQAGNR